MSAVSSESANKLRDAVSLCHTSIAATWMLGLAIAFLVAILSLSAGALPTTSVVRGGICFLVLGLIGWGINAILVTADEKVAHRAEIEAEDESATIREEDAQP